jgi:predicted Zn-dependent protease|tara:strand:- start:688 stop:1413 length:726 start_codon:yes stop_codon:yes gene_type:complete
MTPSRLIPIIVSFCFGAIMVSASNFSLASGFDADFLSAAKQLSKEKIPRPVVRSDDEGRELIQNIHFRIFDVTKKICMEEQIKDKICRWNIRVERSPEFNAFATKSNQIIISSGLIDKVTFEDELAFVVAHEVAHHLLNHIRKNRNIVFSGAILGELVFGDPTAGFVLSSIIKQMNSREYESSADKIALRIISLAGYDIQKARYVLMRMSKMERRLSSRFMQSHPSGIERLVALDRTLGDL